ncbi:hypothetical protein [Alteribacillus sp. YIM 98480]|uniref:hypothetical protein n=1 Tax=Alteribacillus sp. YIM 98480 TaxID=2606599 RepID=UPI00131A7E14|nr:hypothetical protein [Alteribacillus sp. YIM 98480]
MINKKNVVRMKVPFPGINSALAQSSHMYICMREGSDKKFIKCQTQKPQHLHKKKRPYCYVSESADVSRNPFKNTTIIDCDKEFLLSNLVIDRDLITTRRPDVCEELFIEVKSKSDENSDLEFEDIDPDDICSVNEKIKKIN